MAPMKRHPRWLLRTISVASLAIFVAAWEGASHLKGVTTFLLPPPRLIFEELLDEFRSGDLSLNIRLTLGRMLAGYSIAVVVGVPLGIALARSRWMRWALDPLLSVALPMPQVAFLPIFILWLGVGDSSKITLITASTIFPIIVQTWAGARDIDKFMIWSAASLGVSKREFIPDIVIPAALPQIFTGLQIALPIALITTIVAEMFMGGIGLGGSIINGMRMSESPQLFAGIVVVGAIGFLLDQILTWLRRSALIWHPETDRR